MVFLSRTIFKRIGNVKCSTAVPYRVCGKLKIVLRALFIIIPQLLLNTFLIALGSFSKFWNSDMYEALKEERSALIQQLKQ